MSRLIADLIVSSISCGDGQMSRRNTSLPSESLPRASTSKSKSMVPARRVGDDQRRRGQVVHLHVGGDATLEVAVAREHRGDRQIVVVDGLRDLLGQRAGVADAGGAAEAAHEEAQLLEVRPQAGLLVVVGDDLRARGHVGLHPRLGRQALLDGVASQQRRTDHDRRVRGVGAGGDTRDHDGTVIEHEVTALADRRP